MDNKRASLSFSYLVDLLATGVEEEEEGLEVLSVVLSVVFRVER
jgi:hypothetical protein